MHPKKRHEDNRENRFSISTPTLDDPTLVICPACQKMAKIFPAQNQPETGYFVNVTCISCGFSKHKKTDTRQFFWHGDNPTDSIFGFSLWLKIACCGHSLWAFNIRHLDLLFNYASAELRERKQDESGYANASIISRLPLWIKNAKNRTKVTAAITKLRQTVL